MGTCDISSGNHPTKHESIGDAGSSIDMSMMDRMGWRDLWHSVMIN